jgi:hypothetical protein
MKQWWVIAAATVWLAACASVTGGAPSFSVLESEGAYANPNDTPPAERRVLPPTVAGLVHLSPIPGESGVSNTSSVLGGGGGHR